MPIFSSVRSTTSSAVGFLLVAWTIGHAQTSAGGSIRGRVADASGAIVSNATIVAISPNVAGAFHAIADTEGAYRLLDLPPANDYTVAAEKPGFSKFERKGVTVRAGLNIALDIDLVVGNVNQTVEVAAGDTPLLETVSAEQAVDISGELVRSLPLTGRREWSDTLQLTPGILSASTDAYGGQVYFVRGSENENHATLLDGADIGSFEQNWPSNFISISTESLGDVQVKTGASDASSPSAMGMVINLATPTGGDDFHGSLAAVFAASVQLQQHAGWAERGIRSPAARFLVERAYQEAQGVVFRLRAVHQPRRRHQPHRNPTRAAKRRVPGLSAL
jgi:hypothetical protein